MRRALPAPVLTLGAFALGLVVRAWVASLRLVVDVAPGAEPAAGARVLCFWHGQQLPLLALARRRPTAALVSWSADGALQAALLGRLGLEVVRGSSSRGGARGLARLIRRLRRGIDAAFALDGPRGPRGVPKPGAAAAARLAGVALVPVGVFAPRALVLRRAWDQFEVPWPFTRVAVVVGAPLPAADGAPLAAAMGAAHTRARALLAEPVGRRAGADLAGEVSGG